MIQTYKELGVIEAPELKDLQKSEIQIFYNRSIRKYEELVKLLIKLQDSIDESKKQLVLVSEDNEAEMDRLS